jgi:predicted Zn-dependent protease
MSVKSFADLPFQELFRLAEEKYESLDYEEAEYFYGLAYAKNPQDEMLVMCYANLLKTTQQEKKAQTVLERNIQDVPAGTYKRFMELADIYHGVHSIQTYERGIDAARKCLANPFKSTAPEPEIKRDIAQAYAGIAEVCLTDLLEERDAEAKCL